MSRFHTIYKTTCVVTGKYYIGMHSSKDPNDSYLGSGKILARSIAKHGIENHKKEILHFAEDRKSLSILEEQIVNEEMLKDPLCMNLKVGGIGGAMFGHVVSEETKRKLSEANKGKPVPEERKRKMSVAKKGKYYESEKRVPVIIHGVEYPSIIEASKQLGINDRTISTRLRSKFNGDYLYKGVPKEVKKVVNQKRKRVSIDGVVYETRDAAAKAVGVCATLITRRCQSDKWPMYFYLDK